jgi:hypothetical protein
MEVHIMQSFFPMLLVPVLVVSLASPGNCIATGASAVGTGQPNLQVPSNDQLVTESSRVRLLLQINRALIDGYLSVDEAVYLRQAVDVLAENDDKVIAQGNSISPACLSQERRDITAIQALLNGYVLMAQEHKFKGSAQLQEQVLNKVDVCLLQGKIPLKQASDIKAKVNGICAEETWNMCRDDGDGTIPDAVLEQDTKALAALDGELKTNQTESEHISAGPNQIH